MNIYAVQAAIAPIGNKQTSLEVPFYKSTSSLFPSGSTSVEKLKKELIGIEHKADRFFKWNKLYFSQNEITPIFATHLSRYVIDPKTSKRYKVIETSTKTIQLFDEPNKVSFKKNIQDVIADAYDLGFVITLKDLYLKSSEKDNSPILTTIPQGTRLVADKYVSNFAYVRYQNYQGYIHLSELITKFDLATFVFANKNWHQVKARQFDKIITIKNITLSLNEVQGVITPDSKGIIASASQKLPLWSQIEIVQDKLSIWNQSKLKDHGLVWWKNNENSEQIYYTIDELLKKEISSVSFHPNNQLKGVLSSDGVYITENGQIWKKLPKFENFNGPVHFFNDLLIFVGNFRSIDGGVTFDNYIQIDKLASAIEYQFGFLPKKLQVKKIETDGPLKLKLEIETGIRKIKMQSPLFSQDWKAIKG